MNYRVIISPQTDRQFVDAVERAATAERTIPSDLETVLRPTYPNVLVRNGVEDADGRARWYVYREGHWVPG